MLNLKHTWSPDTFFKNVTLRRTSVLRYLENGYCTKKKERERERDKEIPPLES